ncbi:hypothetical protein [Pseudomonas koreensis]|uniref:Uncharacterized protein n=1 Tax=Pseudomonas koreensis TaxID=198620 RepID=A0A9X2XE78_9PSED|nr:hypothetical protein [Pseudomonas koreensis]MCU7246986.1 hypothetical protein [Pseudomonas koreensis]
MIESLLNQQDGRSIGLSVTRHVIKVALPWATQHGYSGHISVRTHDEGAPFIVVISVASPLVNKACGAALPGYPRMDNGDLTASPSKDLSSDRFDIETI